MERLDRVLLVHKERAAVSKSTVFIITAKESNGNQANLCVCVCYVLFFFLLKKIPLTPDLNKALCQQTCSPSVTNNYFLHFFLIGWLGSQVNKQLNILTLTGCRVEV